MIFESESRDFVSFFSFCLTINQATGKSDFNRDNKSPRTDRHIRNFTS